jgi:hypothetical protein
MALAEWLNSHERPSEMPLADWLKSDRGNSLAMLLGMFLGIERGAKIGGESLTQKWKRLWRTVSLPMGYRGNRRIPLSRRPLALDSAEWGFRFWIGVRPLREKLAFDLHPVNETSVALWSIAILAQSDMADRVRICVRCKRFFFARQARSTLCSQRCRESAWRKTDAGRKARAAYMRDLRAKRKRLWEAKQRGRILKRGRNLHVSLKRGE